MYTHTNMADVLPTQSLSERSEIKDNTVKDNTMFTCSGKGEPGNRKEMLKLKQKEQYMPIYYKPLRCPHEHRL